MCGHLPSPKWASRARCDVCAKFLRALGLLIILCLLASSRAEWSAIAESKELYTDKVCELSSSRRLAPAHLNHDGYRRYGYRLVAIVEHLGVYYATVNRRLKRAEQGVV